jgi:hypothetical protein
MLEYVDRCDSGNLTWRKLEHPAGWILLSFIMDPRTGLGRYRDYRIQQLPAHGKLVEMCRTQDVEAILKDPDVAERIDRYTGRTRCFATCCKNAQPCTATWSC